MGASSPISKAGTRSRKPTGFLALMAGTGKPWTPVASWHVKTGGHSSPCMSRRCASPCTPTGRLLFARAMAPAKVVLTRPVRFTIPHLRRRRPMPPSVPWPPLANHSGLSSIGRTRRACSNTHPHCSRPLQIHHHSRVSVYTPTTPHQFLGRRITMDRHLGFMTELLRRDQAKTEEYATAAPVLAPTAAALAPTKIDKSQLAIAEPKRLRDKAHLKFVASQPCLVCGRQPCDPHHLRFAQPRALGLKVSDEFTVPLCRGHHRQLHQVGNEKTWWEDLQINALEIAKGLWEKSHFSTAQFPSA